MARAGFSPATRVFEAAGAAACVISDAWDGIEDFFEPEREILIAADGAEVLERLCGLSEERRRQIGLAARKRALETHSYARRAVEVERALGVISSGGA
jgi:spore maturation protein CgeB